MNDSSQGDSPEPPAEAPGANGAATGDATEANDAPAPADLAGIEELQGRIASLNRELADAKDLARRAQADIANVRRRSRNERAEFRSRATEEVCSALLPVLDDLHRATLETAKTTERWEGEGHGDPAETRPESVVRGLHEGIQLVLRRFQDTLKRQGLLEIDAGGAPFDPRLHEAVQEVPAGPGQQEGDVVEVLRRGYLLDGRVIRPATVIVASAPPEVAEDPERAAGGEGSDESSGGPATGAPPPGSSAEPTPT